MVAITLDDLVEQQRGTNTRLDSVDNRFVEFFQQIAKDKLAMMEMMRELASPAEVIPESATPDKSEKSESGAGLFGIGLGLSTIAGALAAVALNSAGAVLGLDKMASGLKSLGGKFTGWISDVGAKFKDIGSKALSSITEKIKGFGGATTGVIASKVSNLKSAAGAKIESARKGITEFISPTERTKSGKALGETFQDASGRLQTIVKNANGQLVPQFAKAGAVVGGAPVQTILGAIGERASQAAGAFKQSSVGKFAAQNADRLAKFGMGAVKVASKVAAPLAVATAGYEGYTLAQEDPSLTTEQKLAVGTAGAASSIVGGFIDFAKLITVDAFIEAGQRLGVVPEKGFLQDLQEGSVQKQLDKGIRAARDYAVRPAATEEIGRQTMASVGENGRIIVTNVNNVNAPTTTQNNVSSTSSDQMSSPINGNGSRSDAYVMG